MSGVMGRKRSSERVCKQGAWKIHSFFLIRITPVRLLDSPLLVDGLVEVEVVGVIEAWLLVKP